MRSGLLYVHQVGAAIWLSPPSPPSSERVTHSPRLRSDELGKAHSRGDGGYEQLSERYIPEYPFKGGDEVYEEV